jgi:hypothetical protein
MARESGPFAFRVNQLAHFARLSCIAEMACGLLNATARTDRSFPRRARAARIASTSAPARNTANSRCGELPSNVIPVI